MGAHTDGGTGSQRSSIDRSVLIVSRNLATIDGLQVYLSGAGIGTTSAQTLDELVQRLAARRPLVCVVFPDDFFGEEVDVAFDSLRKGAAGWNVVVVTRSPQRFDGRFEGSGCGVVVLPKPAWGWTIRDAVLGRMQPERAGKGAAKA